MTLFYALAALYLAIALMVARRCPTYRPGMGGQSRLRRQWRQLADTLAAGLCWPERTLRNL